jgi:5-formaminoimidazole-4-carboxamide-1-beta-D-ribofuranosyl 5'-monophosphate synthetase
MNPDHTWLPFFCRTEKRTHKAQDGQQQGKHPLALLLPDHFQVRMNDLEAELMMVCTMQTKNDKIDYLKGAEAEKKVCIIPAKASIQLRHHKTERDIRNAQILEYLIEQNRCARLFDSDISHTNVDIILSYELNADRTMLQM